MAQSPRAVHGGHWVLDFHAWYMEVIIKDKSWVSLVGGCWEVLIKMNGIIHGSVTCYNGFNKLATLIDKMWIFRLKIASFPGGRLYWETH